MQNAALPWWDPSRHRVALFFKSEIARDVELRYSLKVRMYVSIQLRHPKEVRLLTISSCDIL